MLTKKCSKCKKELPLTTEYFHREKRYKGGFTARCKKCRNTYSREVYKNSSKEDKEKWKKRTRRSRLKCKYT